MTNPYPFNIEICPACQIPLTLRTRSGGQYCNNHCPIQFIKTKAYVTYITTPGYRIDYYLRVDLKYHLLIRNDKNTIFNNQDCQAFPFTLHDMSSVANLEKKIALLIAFQ